MRTRRAPLRTLLVLALGAATVVPALAQPARPARPSPDVILLGSSSVNGALGMLIEHELEQAGHVVQRDGRPSTGLSRPDFFDWRAQVGRYRNLPELKGVLVYLGGNDAQAFRLRDDEVPEGTPEARRWIQFRDEARWSEAYRARVTQFVDTLCAANVRKVVVIPPIDGDEAGHATRIQRIQRLQSEGTRASRCGVVADASEVELTGALAGDGVHLNREGARFVWRALADVILGALRG